MRQHPIPVAYERVRTVFRADLIVENKATPGKYRIGAKVTCPSADVKSVLAIMDFRLQA